MTLSNQGVALNKVIPLAELLGPICVDAEDGFAICSLIRHHLNAGDAICLDFTGVSALTTEFLTASVGCLHGTFPLDDLQRRLTCRGLNKTSEDLVDIVRQSSAQYYGGSDETRDAIDKAAVAHVGHC